jgi:hypothetical protein
MVIGGSKGREDLVIMRCIVLSSDIVVVPNHALRII